MVKCQFCANGDDGSQYFMRRDEELEEWEKHMKEKGGGYHFLIKAVAGGHNAPPTDYTLQYWCCG